jgi:hypothetical protein
MTNSTNEVKELSGKIAQREKDAIFAINVAKDLLAKYSSVIPKSAARGGINNIFTLEKFGGFTFILKPKFKANFVDRVPTPQNKSDILVKGIEVFDEDGTWLSALKKVYKDRARINVAREKNEALRKKAEENRAAKLSKLESLQDRARQLKIVV